MGSIFNLVVLICCVVRESINLRCARWYNVRAHDAAMSVRMRLFVCLIMCRSFTCSCITLMKASFKLPLLDDFTLIDGAAAVERGGEVY